MTDKDNQVEKQPFYIKSFFPLLLCSGLVGGLLALSVPLWRSPFLSFLNPFIQASEPDKYPEGKAIADLRLHILYITGGIIAMLTLLQTDWKNRIDRRKVEDDIQKNSNDHTRQVHAERRTRYTKAIEQLADDKASIRLGGIYTLVGLVDEWLDDDKTLSDSAEDSNKRKKEGQIIVNSLCAYIRSPIQIPKESKNITHETAEDQGVRQAIFREMSSRIKLAFEENENFYNHWADFEYDFSNSNFSYPLSGYTFTSPDFSGSTFQEGSNISKSEFYGAPNFNKSHFEMDLNLTGTKFYNKAYFERAKFSKRLLLSNTLFVDDLLFIGARFYAPIRLGETQFNGDVFFSHTKFIGTNEIWSAVFKNAIFKGRVYFSDAHFKVPASFKYLTFLSKVSFFNATFEKSTAFEDSIFCGSVSFHKTKLKSKSHFHKIAFLSKAWFPEAKFEALCTYNFISFRGPTIFTGSDFFANSVFNNIIFHGSTDICGANFSESPIFRNALFSINKYAKYINPNSPISKEVNIGIATLLRDNKMFLSRKELPVGARLFDPSSWNSTDKKYDRISHPAL